jgi:hypothetical protein
MQDWWTYSLSDFLLFSPRAYYRMLQRYNQALWPGQLVTLGLGLGILALLWRRSARQGRIIAGVVALMWIWVAGGFLWQRYATINWAIRYIAPAFVLQALLLILLLQPGASFRISRTGAGMVGGSLFVLALGFFPLLAPILGRPFSQAEVFGLFPDPTAVGTLGLLLLLDRPAPWWCMTVPVLWCFLSGATLWAMGQPDALIAPGAAVVALVTRSKASVIEGGRA